MTSRTREQELQRPLTIASSSGRDRFANALYQHLDIVLSLAMRLRTPAAIADACERTLRWKGAALTWGASQVQALAVSTAVEVKSLRRDFIEVRRETIRRTIGGPAATEDSATPIEELQRREEALDREIARQLSSAARRGVTTATPIVSLETVAAALHDGSALIEYVRYESIDFDRGGPADVFAAGRIGMSHLWCVRRRARGLRNWRRRRSRSRHQPLSFHDHRWRERSGWGVTSKASRATAGGPAIKASRQEQRTRRRSTAAIGSRPVLTCDAYSRGAAPRP